MTNAALSDWRACAPPELKTSGERVCIAPFNADAHAQALFDALCGPENENLWTYIPRAQPGSADEFARIFETTRFDPVFGWRPHVIMSRDGADMLGSATYMRNRPEHGSTEIGFIFFSGRLSRTAAATEAMYLMARHAFDDLGYRRYEWKCDAANAASRRAAERLGFSFEGEFRQDMVLKGRSRDTRWYSILDGEWPACKAALEAWLAPENFDEADAQRRTLEQIRAEIIGATPLA